MIVTVNLAMGAMAMSKKKVSEAYLHDCPECLHNRVYIVEDTEGELKNAGWKPHPVHGNLICPNCHLARELYGE